MKEGLERRSVNGRTDGRVRRRVDPCSKPSDWRLFTLVSGAFSRSGGRVQDRSVGSAKSASETTDPQHGARRVGMICGERLRVSRIARRLANGRTPWRDQSGALLFGRLFKPKQRRREKRLHGRPRAGQSFVARPMRKSVAQVSQRADPALVSQEADCWPAELVSNGERRAGSGLSSSRGRRGSSEAVQGLEKRPQIACWRTGTG